ncbi:MAG TPA: hypothetical protein VIL37_05345 [Natronosporangium sp.]
MSVRKGVLELVARGLAFRGYTPRWIAGQVVVAAGLALVASGAVNLLIAPSRRYLGYWQLWLLLTAALLVVWFARPVREPPASPEVDPLADVELTDRPYAVADRWARRLSVTSGDPEWFDRVVRDRLAALVAERLWQRHGVRRLDPELLGDELAAFLTTPLTRTPTPAELARLITRMEQL